MKSLKTQEVCKQWCELLCIWGPLAEAASVSRNKLQCKQCLPWCSFSVCKYLGHYGSETVGGFCVLFLCFPQSWNFVYKFQLRTGMLWCLKHGRVTSAGSWCCIQGERRVQRIGCELQIWMKAGSSITLARTQTYSWSWAYGSGFCARSVNEISGASFLQGHLRLNLLQSLRYSAPTKLNDKLKFLKSYLYPALSQSFPFSLKKPWAGAEGREVFCPLTVLVQSCSISRQGPMSLG